MKRLPILILAILLVATQAFGQSSAGGRGAAAPASFQLTISVNPGNAQIFVDGAQIKGNVATVAAGNHTIMTKAAGYLDFTTTVSVSGNMTLPVTMQAATFQLSANAANVKGAQVLLNGKLAGNAPFNTQLAPGTYTITIQAPGFVAYSESFTLSGPKSINATLQQEAFQLSVNAANVKGAQVLLNGKAAGNAPFTSQLQPGTYTVTVQAPGFLAYNESFTLSGPKSIDVTLQPATFQLSVNAANVKGAQVLLNGSPAGSAPFNTQLAPATYTVTVQAPGFVAYSESFTLTGPKSINVTLQPAMGTVNVVLPAANINTDMKGGHWSQIIIWVDGVQQRGQSVQLPPGRRLIKITSGGLQVEGFYDIEAGQTYTFEPFMGLNLKK